MSADIGLAGRLAESGELAARLPGTRAAYDRLVDDVALYLRVHGTDDALWTDFFDAAFEPDVEHGTATRMLAADILNKHEETR